MPAWRWSKLYQRKNRWQWARASSMEPKRPGKSGRYLSVLNWLSENGLSFDTRGRLWLLVTPRSASRWAIGFEGMELPRSAWMVRVSRLMRWEAHVPAMRRLASSADSAVATIQPTT